MREGGGRGTCQQCSTFGRNYGYRPIAVKEDDNIGRDEVDAETSSAGREEEGELIRVRGVVLVDGSNTVLVGSASVDTAVL